MSFDFDELKHKAGNMLEKGKEKAHEAAESEKGQKIKSKAGELFEKGKEKAHEFAESETGKKVKNKAEKLLDKGIDKAENVYEKHKERKAEQKEQPEDKEKTKFGKESKMSSFIEIKDLHFSYVNDLEEPPVKTEVLKGINLNIEKGEFVAVLGHNGSGKSTLAKCINAINLPESGAVYVNGMDTLDENNLLPIREKVGMVFQNPDNQIVATIVEEDVAFALENMGVEPNEIRRRVDEALKTVGMYEYRLHAPHKLSGGQKQRVAIAGIIAMKPDCILLDEPTAMLDPHGRDEVMKTVKMLNEQGVTIVLITHYMEEAADADYVVILDNGKIAAEGTPLQLKNEFTGDFITLYHANENDIKNLGLPYEIIKDACRVAVKNTEEARNLIMIYPSLFTDFEITKGKMDDVFLAVTGKKPEGGVL